VPICYYLQVLDKRKYIQYREHSFLDHPLVPRHVLWDKETVYFYWPGEPQPPRYGTGVNVVMGPELTSRRLRELLRGVDERSVLHLENLEPHSFAGFERPEVRIRSRPSFL
jgi:hypothetical protein